MGCGVGAENTISFFYFSKKKIQQRKIPGVGTGVGIGVGIGVGDGVGH